MLGWQIVKKIVGRGGGGFLGGDGQHLQPILDSHPNLCDL